MWISVHVLNGAKAILKFVHARPEVLIIVILICLSVCTYRGLGKGRREDWRKDGEEEKLVRDADTDWAAC